MDGTGISMTSIIAEELQRSKESNQRMEYEVLRLRGLLREAAGQISQGPLADRIRVEVG